MTEGYKYFIEHTGTHLWWAGTDWTNDSHAALQFDTAEEAGIFIGRNRKLNGLPVDVTEHEFVPTPSPIIHKLN